MKKNVLISVFVIFFSFFLNAQAKKSDFHLEVSQIFGLKDGMQNEFVYQFVENENAYKKLSQLDWEMKKLFYLGGKIDFRYRNFSFNFLGAGFLPQKSGTMTDSDWFGIASGFSEKTHLSKSENELSEGFFLDTSAGYRLNFSDFLSIKANFGFEYNYYFFMASNGYAWYGNSSTPYYSENAIFHPKSGKKEISLERINYSVYFLVNSEFHITRYFEVNPFFKVAPFSFFKEIDHHILREIFWYDNGNSFFSENQFGIEIIAKPLKKISFCLEYSYTFNIRYKGEIAANTEGEEKPFVLQKGIKSAFEQKMHNFSIGAKWTIF